MGCFPEHCFEASTAGSVMMSHFKVSCLYHTEFRNKKDTGVALCWENNEPQLHNSYKPKEVSKWK
jgi:hypothetical protein